jgi:ubiquinone/menaquinone biosynthesis C-methylase UbiE
LDIWERWLTRDRYLGLSSAEVETGRQMIAAARAALAAFLDLQPGMNVLEVGCGEGEWIPWLLSRIPGGRLVAVDISAGLIDIARRRLAQSPMAAEAHRVTWLCHDIRTPVPCDERWDAICGRSVLQYVIADLPAVLGHLHHTMAGGGKLAFFEASPGDDPVALPAGIPEDVRRRVQEAAGRWPRPSSQQYWEALRDSAFSEVRLDHQRFSRRARQDLETSRKLMLSPGFPGAPCWMDLILDGIEEPRRSEVRQMLLEDGAPWIWGGAWCYLYGVA